MHAAKTEGLQDLDWKTLKYSIENLATSLLAKSYSSQLELHNKQEDSL